MPHERKLVTRNLNVLALSEEIEHESQSGALSRELLAQGQTLYGKNPIFAEYLDRISPYGKKSLGHWKNGEFQQFISLL